MSQPIRKIIHIDMDAFFASVEQRDNPELRGKPVAVGGSRARGVVAAASYEARKYGVHSALASKIAAQRCPHLIFVKARFDVYSAVSRQIREIFFAYTDLVEPLSLDEAYLDVTENKIGMPSATIIANQIRQRIFEETGLTASAGVSYNKFLAKIASDMNKPNGFTLITPDKAEDLVASLDIGKFHGIGKVTAAKMQSMGIITGADLRERSEAELIRNFGKVGSYYYRIARAQDDRDVQPHRIRKSIGSERTFEADIAEEEAMLEHLLYLSKEVAQDMERLKATAKTITLKIKYFDFTLNTRSKTFLSEFSSEDAIYTVARDLLRTPQLPQFPVRLLGISASSLLYQHDRLQEGYQFTLEF
ncbi:DNA polymerase IV [Pontibacter sp. BT310]|uniref:DNA polymerase IV n=1 Tax=Pontibacter populi TaxID=890055 RepID=A0ABS6XB58_9BACT|nr:MULTISPECIES: DNA polymerase IV [Pontibacter]MBJ6118377.1 DNA polymerase IV [Pontibacter sp. BT310]MBW3365230.1 DNA polymerase IV [Pontibacter populi]